ncbi:MAG: hypothetical protein LBD31_00035 [Treponema sp.]|nr:hypothetical protein [Treponema sp.]
MRDGKNGLTLASDHPFWKTFGFPPYHYQCRTGIQAVYKSQIGQGVQVENPAMDDMKKQFAPMKGFGGNPLEKESWWKITPGMVERAGKYGIDGDVVLLAHKLGMANYALELVKGYETLFVSKSGGYVKKAKLAKPGKENRNEKGHWVETDELGTAQKAADSGHQIFFLPKTKVQGISNLDVIIDNDLAEIKHIFTATERAIDTAIKSAKKQGASTVLIEIVTLDLSWETVKKAVEDRLGSHVRKALIYWKGTLHTLLK